MNTPYGKLVSAGDVVASLKSGFLTASTQEANDILEALFTEVPPDLILKCADQIQAPLGRVNHLYQVTLDRGQMRSQAWEDAVGALDLIRRIS